MIRIMDAKDPTRFGRRGFLASIASSGLLAGLVGVRSAASDDDAGPVTVSGRRIHKYRPDGDFFEHEQRFVSPELRDYYGKATLVYDEGTIHRRAVPDEYTDPDRAFTLNYRDTAVIGRFREFDRLETKQRDAGSADAAVGTASIPDYTGPLYVYNSDVDNPQEEDLGEATGPINVGWNRDLDRDAASINSQMESWGWTSLYAGSPGDRYVIMDEDASLPYVTKQDEHIVKGLSTPTTQYHVRAYDLPQYEEENIAVAGQAHKDPVLHDGPPWNFAEAREAASSAWDDNGYSTVFHYVENGEGYDTSDGFFDQVRAD
ncbi:hypothetical protein [Natrinema sp. CGMCC1.2065]|uniref:hypothetical protein n=1 Tax=Natrinema sp. CGMCC1.2065 TaxID=3445767 RepID=UPI003F4A1DD7